MTMRLLLAPLVLLVLVATASCSRDAAASSNRGFPTAPSGSGAGGVLLNPTGAQVGNPNINGNLNVSLGISGNSFAGNIFYMAATAPYTWVGRARMYSMADGHVNLTNSNATDFDRLVLGPTSTSGFPALRKTSAASIEARAGDNSATAYLVSNGGAQWEGKLGTVTGVDLNSTAKQTLITVPAGKTAVVTKVILRNASTSLTTASCGFGFDAGGSNVVVAATHTELTDATSYTMLAAKVGSGLGTGGATFGIKCGTAQGATATADVDVYGAFY